MNTNANELDGQIKAYAAAMITTLRRERDLERKAHEQTRQNAEFRIIELEAQLAHRDAELEACIIHTCHSLDQHQIYGERENIGVESRTNPRISKEEANIIMDTTSTRNKLLEQEIQGLAKRVRDISSSRSFLTSAFDTATQAGDGLIDICMFRLR